MKWIAPYLIATSLTIGCNSNENDPPPTSQEKAVTPSTQTQQASEPKEATDKTSPTVFAICNDAPPIDIAEIEQRKKLAEEIKASIPIMKASCPSPFLTLSRESEKALNGLNAYLALRDNFCLILDTELKIEISSKENSSCLEEYQVLAQDIEENLPALKETAKESIPTKSRNTNLFFELGEKFNSDHEFYVFSGSLGTGDENHPVAQWIYPSKEAEEALKIKNLSLKIGLSDDGTINQYRINRRYSGISYNQLQRDCIENVNGLFPANLYAEVPSLGEITYKDERIFLDNAASYRVKCNFSPNEIQIHAKRNQGNILNNSLIEYLATFRYIENINAGANKIASKYIDHAIAEEQRIKEVRLAEKYFTLALEYCPSPLQKLGSNSASEMIYFVAYNSDKINEKRPLIEDQRIKSMLTNLTDQCIEEYTEIRSQIVNMMGHLESQYNVSMSKTDTNRFNFLGYEIGENAPSRKFKMQREISKDLKPGQIALIEFPLENKEIESRYHSKGQVKASIYLAEGTQSVEMTKLSIDYLPFGSDGHCIEVAREIATNLERIGYFRNPTNTTIDNQYLGENDSEYLGKNDRFTLKCSNRDAEFIGDRRYGDIPDFYRLAVYSIIQ